MKRKKQEPLALVVARSANGVIGCNGNLPWHLPEDLAHFKQITMGHAVIMGRLTYESIGKPLPGRRNIIVSTTIRDIPGCEVANDLILAIQLARTTDSEPRVIGGSRLFAEALPLATRIFITEIHAHYDGDTYFNHNLSRFKTVLLFPSPIGNSTFIEMEVIES